MSERLKSRVLHREEKFMGTVTMARFLACILSAGVTYFVLRLIGSGAFNIIVSAFVFVLAVIFTADKFGLMRYQWLLLQIKGRLLVDAHHHPQSFVAQIVDLLGVNTPVVLRASGLFEDTQNSTDDLRGVTILDAGPDEDGFEILTDSDIEVSP